MQHDTTSIKRTGRSSAFLAAALFTVAITGCLTGGDSDDGDSDSDDGDYLIKVDAEVLAITPPQGTEPGRLVTRNTDYSCYDEEDDWIVGTAQPLTYTDTANYAITGGKLYVWSGSECMGEVYSGTSSTINGTWTSTGTMEPVPDAYRNASCAGWLDVCEEYGDCGEGGDFAELFDSLVIRTTISSTGLESRFTGGFCHAREWGEEWPEYLNGIELVSSSCSLVELRNVSAGKIAILTNSLKDGEVTLNVAYNGNTCVRKDIFGPATATTQCPDLDLDHDSFYGCLEESGFYQGTESDYE